MVTSLAFLAAIVHLVLNALDHNIVFYSFDLIGNTVIPVYGFMAFVVFAGMVIFSLEIIRRKYWELFQYMHYLYPVGVAFIILHVSYAWIGFVPGLVLQSIDICVRIYHNVFSRMATKKSFASYTVLEVTFSARSAAIRDSEEKSEVVNKPVPDLCDGEYYFVHIPSVAIGQWHPFSASEARDGRVTFHIQVQGPSSWTAALNRIPANSLRVNIDGPYGSIPLHIPSYETVNFIVGGIGITPFLNLIEAIVGNNDGRYNKVTAINLHWSMRGPDYFDAFLPRLLEMVNQDAANWVERKSTPINLFVYNTTPGFTNFSEVSNSRLISSVFLGRMDVANVVAGMAISKSCLLTCGPYELTACVSREARYQGIDFHSETFHY